MTNDPAQFDLVVVGATAAGVAGAVRAAREGMTVLLAHHYRHLGGMLASGIGVMDALYERPRAPLFDELCDRIKAHYRETYGENSPQYLTCLPGSHTDSLNRMTFEPHVAEKVIEDMIGAEPGISVWREFHAVAVERAERTIRAVIFDAMEGAETRRAEAEVFIDGTYEGDLAAVAGVAYRVGREDRNEYNEPHAGRLFPLIIRPDEKARSPVEAAQGTLKIRPFAGLLGPVFAGSTGEGDNKIQAFHFRPCLTNNPRNRRLFERPPGYNREDFATTYRRCIRPLHGNLSPNNKINYWLNFPGENWDYPTGEWKRRREILARFRYLTTGMMYFMQNDPSIPEAELELHRQWGLALDEFPDNDNFPYEIYVREGRRIVGRHIFTEHDASLARGYDRTPIHPDSVGITDWFMDSHEVSMETRPGSYREGKLSLTEITRPAQIPYRCLLPVDIDNLLVAVSISATHVGWGAIRLEPTWMPLGEAAGWAAVLSKRFGRPPAHLEGDLIVQTLVKHGQLVSFFNDCDSATPAPWAVAVQYFATKGFFADFNANADAPLDLATASLWARAVGELLAVRHDPDATARAIFAIDEVSPDITVAGFVALLETAFSYWSIPRKLIQEPVSSLGLEPASLLSRGDACRLCFATCATRHESAETAAAAIAATPTG